MKKIFSLFLLCCCMLAGRAQDLKQSTLSISIDKPYFSLETSKAFTKQQAATAGSTADLLYDETAFGKDIEKNFYNLSDKSGKAAGMVTDKPVKIAGLSWDKDTWDKCKTVADLKRMTTNITNNSFSFFASIANNSTGEIDYPCFIVQLDNGKRAVIFVSKANEHEILIAIKIAP